MSADKKYRPNGVLPGLSPARLEQLQGGEQITYHIGYLPLDVKSTDVRALASCALSLYRDGRALLTQQRTENFTYQYRLTMRRTRGPVLAQSEFDWAA